jgi:hypothetical protein
VVAVAAAGKPASSSVPYSGTEELLSEGCLPVQPFSLVAAICRVAGAPLELDHFPGLTIM